MTLSPSQKGNSVFIIVSIVALLGIIVVGAGLFWMLKYRDAFHVTDKPYTAVFLSDGQVYFGLLSKKDKQYVVLHDIYYLQANRQIQPIDSEHDASSVPNQPDLQLVKFGNEIHGPTDEMRISRDFVILTEQLRDDSAVVSAIQEHKKSQSE